MKLNPNKSSTRPRIFEGSEYEHPWYTYLKKPQPPSSDAVAKAQFKDKTYTWKKKPST